MGGDRGLDLGWVMNRPRLEAVSYELAAGAAIDPLTIMTFLAALLPLLQSCAGGPDTAAGWLRGDDIRAFKRLRVRWRERLVRREIHRRTDNRLIADRIVEKLKRATLLDMTLIYREAGLR